MLKARNYSIKKKLTWMNMLVSGAALLVASVAFIVYELTTFRLTMARNLSIQAQIVGANSASAILFNDPNSAANTLSALKVAPNILSARIYLPSGEPFAVYWRDRRGSALPSPSIPPGQTEAHWFTNNALVLVRSVEFQGKSIGTVYIQSDLQELKNRLRRYEGTVAAVLLISLLAAFVLSSTFQRGTSKPIMQLAELARIVSREKKYSVRAPETASRDEVAVLIEAFNEMLAQIQERDAALQQAHERINLALKGSGVGTWSWSLSDNTITWDNYMFPLFGLEPGGFSGTYEDFLNLVHSKDRERVRTAGIASVERNTPYDVEFHVIWPDGSIHALSARGKVYRESDRPVRLAGVCWDISERKRSEEERQKFVSLVEQTDDFIGMVALDGRILYLNRAGCRLVGLEPEKAAGTDIRDFYPERWCLALRDEIFPAIVRGEGTWVGEAQLCHIESKQPVDVLMNVFPVNHPDTGQLLCFAMVVRDITERKRAEEQIRELNQSLERRVAERTAELEAANKELEAFTYSVAHDLRAPLRHIQGFSNALTEDFGSQLDADAKDYLKRIVEGTQHMGHLINDLLSLAHIGRQELRLQVTGLDSLVREVVRDLKQEAEHRNIDWQIGELPFVDCDPGLIKQVFYNLLSNALKYTRPRNPARIEAGQMSMNGRPVIFVRDNGVGFNMKYAAKLFGVFQRLHRREDFEGTGVGLATVQRIIHKHGGQIWAQAELDKGATFFFTLGSTEKQSL